MNTFTYCFARLSLALVYIWFGILKFFGASPANPLVEELLSKTLPFITFDQFILFLAVLEVAIGLCFLLPRTQKIALVLLIPHLVMTTGPLFLLPAMTWTHFLVPTLEGQYIIKNILILALATVVFAENQKTKV